MPLGTFKLFFKKFLIFILIILDLLLQITFTQSSRLSIQVNSFSRIGTKIWNEMPMSLRKLPKNVFKRKIKQTLFEILTSEDYYIDLPEIVQKVQLFWRLFYWLSSYYQENMRSWRDHLFFSSSSVQECVCFWRMSGNTILSGLVPENYFPPFYLGEIDYSNGEILFAHR